MISDDYGKENNYHRRPSKRPWKEARKKERLKSSSRHDFKMTRTRSYRATSVFSNYSIQKRKTSTKRDRNRKRKPKPVLDVTLSDEENDTPMIIASSDSSADDELLELRLTALKSKQEVKELIGNNEVEKVAPPEQTQTEEELRIMALKSALLKKKEVFKHRKRLKKIENERPYSPSDDFSPIAIEDDAMSLSPLGSPYDEALEHEDMEICYSPEGEEKGASDMDIAHSPNVVSTDQLEEDSHEETALRSLLLTSISKKKESEKTRSPSPQLPLSGTETGTIENLKLAVQRLKKKNKLLVPVLKSGTKTIAMILAEKNKKKEEKSRQIQREPTVSDSFVKEAEKVQPKLTETNDKRLKNSSPPKKTLVAKEKPQDIPRLDGDLHAKNKTRLSEQGKPAPSHPDSFMFRTIKNDLNKLNSFSELLGNSNLQEPSVAIELHPEPIASTVLLLDTDSSFSTITDTKNIPLLPRSEKAAKTRSRLITSLVHQPVSRLVIAVNADSDTDEETAHKNSTKKITTRKIVCAPVIAKPKSKPVGNAFEANLENFLKNIREKTATPEKPDDSGTDQKRKAMSSVKHLPLSSQLEYEQLLKQIKILEDSKQKRMKARQLKRTKSSTDVAPVAVPLLHSSPKKIPKVDETPKAELSKKSAEKITESLSRIAQLNPLAQERLIFKTEINFRTHRCVEALFRLMEMIFSFPQCRSCLFSIF